MKVLMVRDVEENSEKLGYGLFRGMADSVQAAGCELENHMVSLGKISYCHGCFHCWLKTPGVCIYNDLGKEICKAFVNSDVFLIISKVRYGTYSPAVRRALDRLLPDILPYFRVTVNGEIHHKPRYKKYPRFIVIGYSDHHVADDEKATFKLLVDANALNFNAAGTSKIFICSNEKEIPEIIRETAELLIVERNKVDGRPLPRISQVYS